MQMLLLSEMASGGVQASFRSLLHLRSRCSRCCCRLFASFLASKAGKRGLTGKHFMAYPGTNDVFRRFNRDTEWLAAGLLGVVLFAALAFAFLVPERHLRTADLTTEGSQAKSGSLVNADAARLLRIVDLNAKIPANEVTSGTATLVDQSISTNSSKETLSGIEAGAASTPSPVAVLSPGMSSTIAQADGNTWSPDSARVIAARIPKESYRSPRRPRVFDIKMRLVALWHQSLLRSEKARSWAIFSNLNRRKRAGYTAGREP
jgi:hypothetical protein